MNTRHPTFARFSALCVCGLLCGAMCGRALGQKVAPAEAPPLSGPAVGEDLKQTLVQADMRGRFLRIQGRPEEAALAELAIDPDRREKARAVVAERAATIKQLLVDNIDLIRESTDAVRAGDNAKARRLYGELFDRFDPGHTRDPLLTPLAAVLTPQESASVRRLVDEYWQAWIQNEQRSAPKSKPAAIQERLVLDLFQAEVRAVYDYTLRPLQQKLDKIYEAVGPTTAQRAAIRGAVIEYIKEARLEPSEAQRAELAKTIYGVLDEGQRVKLFAAALSAL